MIKERAQLAGFYYVDVQLLRLASVGRDPPTQSLGRNADRRVAVLSGTGYFDSNITILHCDFPTFSKECEAIGS